MLLFIVDADSTLAVYRMHCDIHVLAAHKKGPTANTAPLAADQAGAHSGTMSTQKKLVRAKQRARKAMRKQQNTVG